MLPRTPQKKKSLDLDLQPQTNNSYIFSMPNNSNVIPQQPSTQNNHNTNQLSPQAQLKNSQGNLNLSNKNNKIHNTNNKMSLVRKYVQQEMQMRGKNTSGKEPGKEGKQYREVVISDQFVRSHHLYKMLKQQMAIADARHARQTQALTQILEQADREVKELKQQNHHVKVELWECKTQFMELKSMLEEEEEDNKKLVEEYEYANREEGDEGQQEQQQQQEHEAAEGEDGGNEEQIFQGEQGRNGENSPQQRQQQQADSPNWNSQQPIQTRDKLKQMLEQIKRRDHEHEHHHHINLLPLTHIHTAGKMIKIKHNKWDLEKEQEIRSIGECSNGNKEEQVCEEELEMEEMRHG